MLKERRNYFLRSAHTGTKWKECVASQCEPLETWRFLVVVAVFGVTANLGSLSTDIIFFYAAGPQVYSHPTTATSVVQME